ncbi:transcriptional regulator [Mycobacterium sp. JS623]|uniref:TetR/AcrR family transcriptional regulator n=1 Tax=Mycobacterium sp. JS623 TaxID=212767 RepID=UPI0002A57A20|nr:TetR/AcrR family transcriptional regulator [Mycobacterium sp. JS623]AGB24218.1 transcriptional regulator [Mycobacterium sp. JS623]
MAETAVRRNRPYAPRLTPEQRREQLLDVVLDIIDHDGVAAVSMDAVARRAGVTRPVVYNHFTDSNDMLRASLNREEQRALAQLVGAMPCPGNDPGRAFHHLFDTYLGAVTEAPQRWRSMFLIADSFTPTLHKRVARIRTRIADELEATLRDSSIGGPHADHELLADHLLAVLWESGRLLLVSPRDFTHERLLRSLDALFAAIARS